MWSSSKAERKQVDSKMRVRSGLLSHDCGSHLFPRAVTSGVTSVKDKKTDTRDLISQSVITSRGISQAHPIQGIRVTKLMMIAVLL